MQSQHLGNAFWIAGCCPNFISARDEQSRRGQADSRARSGQKDAFHGLRSIKNRDRIWCFAWMIMERRNVTTGTRLHPAGKGTFASSV